MPRISATGDDDELSAPRSFHRNIPDGTAATAGGLSDAIKLVSMRNGESIVARWTARSSRCPRHREYATVVVVVVTVTLASRRVLEDAGRRGVYRSCAPLRLASHRTVEWESVSRQLREASLVEKGEEAKEKEQTSERIYV